MQIRMAERVDYLHEYNSGMTVGWLITLLDSTEKNPAESY